MSVPLEVELRAAFAGRRVLVTGHTGFKGSWLWLWLASLGAELSGFALPADGERSVFNALTLARLGRHTEGDLRQLGVWLAAFEAARPEIVFHLAAQALVRPSYQSPLETLDINVMGTAHVLEAVRRSKRPCAVVVVTSDKCYENREWVHGYREEDPMGGHDLYSVSKGAAELVTAGYRRSFFSPAKLAEHGVAVCTARAGNVIGGGDWNLDRLVPDAVGALAKKRPIPVRNPEAIRPWQHVLEPLGGYLLLGARLLGVGTSQPGAFCEAWNFGPDPASARPVRELVEALVQTWGEGRWEDRRDPKAPHEAGILRLSIDKAYSGLSWRPRWSFEETLRRTVEWYKAQALGATGADLEALTRAQLGAFQGVVV